MSPNQNVVSIMANRDLEEKYKLPDSKNGKHVVSSYERLRNRLYREIKRKKLVGDIFINDAEFDILIDYLQSFYRHLRKRDWEPCSDLLVCVAMVQIGIRYYDGGYWPHFARLLNEPSWNINRQAVMGKVCIATLHEFNKAVNDENDRINTILMHGFVANKYYDNLIDFLFAYYRIDLERDLARNDRDTMRELLSSMKRKDNSNRTYKLVQQTSDAVTANPIGSNNRLRWLLRLIDASFWGEEIKINTDNRLSRMFGEWMSKSKDFTSSRGARGEKQKIYSSPHLVFDISKGTFAVRLPSQIVRSLDSLFWNVVVDGRTEQLSVEAYESILAYKTEPMILPVKSTELFGRMSFELNYHDNSKRFSLPKEDIRFFTKDGYSIAVSSLKQGEYYAFSPQNVNVESTAVIESQNYAGLRFYYFVFEEGDLLRLPNGTAVCIGKRVEEGLISHGVLSGITSSAGNSVFGTIPSVLLKMKESALSGTAVTVNGTKHRLIDKCSPVLVELEEGKHEKGFWFSLDSLGCNIDGDYEIDVDVPNDRSIRHWNFTLIRNLCYRFDDQSPYVFSAKGSICFQGGEFSVQCLTPGVIYDKEDKSFNFAVCSDNRSLAFSIDSIQISILVPMLEYSFDNNTWNTQKHEAIWHADFPQKIWLRYPTSKIKFEILGVNYGEEETFEAFTKRVSDGVFECDMTRFKSWIDSEKIRNRLRLHCTSKPIDFLDIIARSFVVSGVIGADTESNKLMLQCDIIGKGEYCADVYCNNVLIAEKIPLQEGQAEIDGRVRSGKYHMEVFEADTEEDSWFDDFIYKSIFKTGIEVVNPHDLSGKTLEVVSAMRDEKDLFKLQFDKKYQVKNLSLIDDADEYRYRGLLVDLSSTRTIDVVVEFFDLKQLRYAMISWVDLKYGDELEFLYDYASKQIVCEEQPGLSPSEKYRRYEPLYLEDYFFGVTFMNGRKRI